ncbi:tetratricopeptide repeat-containing sensor histidine kinase [uncultured Sunxiuqinia sp.]|uniref:tetratricopeptide repeat-containing sensor histidine kinase n=1 Tax=uncultured Sunxiuqinia sp. TaxID=1573825 RepID=UPI00260724D8|nr:tetratricopeptide repeat-containing sensor histidine kinase [uncultured Sunxiuqinia sp.]
MKTFILNIFIILLYGVAQGQDSTDSLLIKLQDLEGVDRAKVLVELAAAYASNDSARSIAMADEAIGLAGSMHDSLLLGLAHFNKAECYYYFDRYHAALANYEISEHIFSQQADSVNLVETYNSIGLVHYFTGEYNSAVDYFYKSLNFFRYGDPVENETLAHVYSNLGMVFSRIGEYDKAIQNYRQAARVNTLIDDLYSLGVNYNGLGVSYYNQEQYDSAKVYYARALHLFKQHGSQQREAIALNNIANIYVNTGDSLHRALEYYQQAIEVFEELGDTRNKAFALEGLGSVYRELGAYDKAIKAFHESLNLISSHGYYLRQLNYYDLALTYEHMGRPQDALDAFKLYSSYKDSLLSEERTNQVAELEQKYQAQQNLAEIERLNAFRKLDQLQIKRDKELRAIGIVAILVLVGLIFFLSVAYLSKQRVNELLSRKNDRIEEQRQELEKLNAAKNKLFSIIAHDLKNPFHTVMGYAYVLNRNYPQFSDEERIKFSGDIYKSTTSIFRLLHNLLNWARSQAGVLEYSPKQLNCHELYREIENLLKPHAELKKIRLLSDIPEDVSIYADPMMLEAILRNLLNNAIKFTHENGWVKTHVKNNEHGVIICVEDNGVGMSAEELNSIFQIDSKLKRKGTNKEDGSGLGLLVCNEFVQKNGGTIWVDSKPGEGTRFYFSIPGEKQSPLAELG